VSDNNCCRQDIRSRQLVVFIIESIVAMIGATYFDFLCLVIPLALLTLILIVVELWYVATTSKDHEATADESDEEEE